MGEQSIDVVQRRMGRTFETRHPRIGWKRLKPYEAILVTDEVGLGGVAMHPVSRAFQDGLGWLNQEVAQVADEVWMVIAGIPWRVKP